MTDGFGTYYSKISILNVVYLFPPPPPQASRYNSAVANECLGVSKRRLLSYTYFPL